MANARVLLSWSSGKDSAWSLHVLRQTPGIDVVGLLTTTNQEFDRVAMHAVRATLLREQATAVGLPLMAIPLPWPCSNAQYEEIMGRSLAEAKGRFDMTHMAFGDLFLEDIRAYREDKLAGTGVEPIFPLWGIPTGDLARQMIAGGLKTVLTCVDPRKLPGSFAGRAFDYALLDDLPPSVDPCGENGEFHSFAWDGPMFARPIAHDVGAVVERDGFVFADIMPA